MAVAPCELAVLIVYDQFGSLILADFPAAVDRILFVVTMSGRAFRSAFPNIPTASF
jgi:hypothetical protein